MEIQPSNEDAEMAIPINSTYGGGGHPHHHHYHHHQMMHNHIKIPSCNDGPTMAHQGMGTHKKMANIKYRYRECLKNHAAAMGGIAIDGCGEFMPNGEEGSLESLTCSACNCHRNFHRKELVGHFHYHHTSGPHLNTQVCPVGHHDNSLSRGPPQQAIVFEPHDSGLSHHYTSGPHLNTKVCPVGHHDNALFGGPPQQAIVLEPHDGGAGVKKRHRTKFSQEQKDKMVKFAERVGWKIHKEEEPVVQQFCQEVGVKRRVLKVWMHNNKNTLCPKKGMQLP
ncbi:unnamed protein product [Cuscuta campestris]|uniref:ZF-HD dimerization-type domain-containing protein n=1 Tax=Cuscuta campestris TaxID=132261 RepID=A0A484K556_9ASTE|nr:unnamed protein product [Cuscuta campestris]